MATKRNDSIKKLVLTAVFMAITAFLQLFASSFTVGTVSFSLVLIPIVLCGILVGKMGGFLTGLTFGVITMIGGITGGDVFTATLMQSGTRGFLLTSLICLVKASMAGLLSAIVYKALKNVNNLFATFCAAATAPIVNTGLFILGMLTMTDILNEAFLQGGSVIYFLVVVCAGVNFIIELLVNLIFAPAIYHLIKAVSKGKI
ncbi:MAG: ECF transporter S component [Clostridia bacterium]|nr:ECF transporter S component [Clostridia bacterium]